MLKYHDPFYIITARVALAITFTLSGLSGLTNIGLNDYFSLNEAIVGDIGNSPHFYILKTVELIISICFLSNFFVQTALLVATPIIVSAIGYHLWVNPVYGAIALLLLVPITALFIFYKDTYKIFFKPQLYTNHMAEDSPKILIYDEVSEKCPDLLEKFDEIYTQNEQ
jgi:uncharacterized membrane protein YphA (DoxX/SURF4 family)